MKNEQLAAINGTPEFYTDRKEMREHLKEIAVVSKQIAKEEGRPYNKAEIAREVLFTALSTSNYEGNDLRYNPDMLIEEARRGMPNKIINEVEKIFNKFIKTNKCIGLNWNLTLGEKQVTPECDACCGRDHHS